MNAFPDDPTVDGDPDAPDPNGAYEPILDDDPHPSLTMNPDAGDPLENLDEGEDSDEPLDDDEDQDDGEGPDATLR